MITQVHPRESRLILLETGSFQTKAGYVDYTIPPAVTIATLVGVKARACHIQEKQALSPDEKENVKDEPMAMDVDEAPTEGESNPDNFTQRQPNIDAEQEGADYDVTYVAGAQLQAEQGGADGLELIKPIKDGLPMDWAALGGLWQHILLRELPTPVKRARNDWSVMLSVPVSWSKEDHKRATQFMFEEMNILAFSVIEQPLVAMFGHNLTTGLVIDIGHETTDITPVIDNNIIRHAQKTIPIGGRDIEESLSILLREDATSVGDLGDTLLDEHILRTIKETSACAIPPDGREDERLSLTVNGKQVSVGSARYRCVDVLFDPLSAGKNLPSIQEACYLAITEACEPEKRANLWESIILTGGCSNLKGIKQRLDKEIGALIAASETSNEFQAKELRWGSLPEYLIAYKERPQDAAYVGASIVARIVFLGSQFGYVTKADYNEIGPAAIYLKS